MKRRFIVNPRAGGNIRPCLERLRRRFGRDADLVLSESWHDAVRRTREALHEGCGQIVAVGGDGTLNAVVNGWFENGRPVNPEALVAVAGLGTGSDYFRMIRAEAGGDWMDWLDRFQPRSVDAGRIEASSDGFPPRYFINMASAGMVADVVARKDRAPRWLPRNLSYLAAAVASMFAFTPFDAAVTAGDEEVSGRLSAIFVAKGRYAGGGMAFGGAVDLDDGLFDITVIRAMSPWAMLIRSGRLYSGDLGGLAQVTKMKAPRIAIAAEPPSGIECDGEIVGSADVRMDVVPRSVRICFPG